MEAKDIDVNVSGNMLIIKGEKRQEKGDALIEEPALSNRRNSRPGQGTPGEVCAQYSQTSRKQAKTKSRP
jgi:hypothetical protein